MDRQMIRDGAVVFDEGVILAIGSAAEMARAHPDAALEDLGEGILLPGLVNAHTHLELSGCAADTFAGATFADWILSLRSRMTAAGATLEEAAAAGVRAGARQCLRFGVTTVGDITQHGHITRPLLAAGPLGGVSYGEVLGLAKLRRQFDELFARAVDTRHESEFLKVGLTPHAPYTVDQPGYEQALKTARQRKLPLASHLAETADEQTFLEHHAGEFRDIWDKLGLWEEPVQTFRGPPLQFAQAIGLLDYPTLLAHVNYCDNEGLNLLARGQASVVYCPRTHKYFRHPPHRWREMIGRGINVAVGTDSCASSPDLNLVDDLCLLHEIAPDVPPHALWEMATIRGAAALQQAERIGSLTPGKQADFVYFPAAGDDPLRDILERSIVPEKVWVRGNSIDDLLRR
jgi:cytosine/adenosine deaminase-related metal-dependent hydrolase